MGNHLDYQPLLVMVLGVFFAIIIIAIQIFIVRWILRINAIIFYLEQQCELLDKNNKELQKINEKLIDNIDKKTEED